MDTSKATAERHANRAAARKVADHIEQDLPHDSDMPAPVAESFRYGADAIQHWLQTSQDMARFMNARLAKDFSYLTEFGTCRSPHQVASLWCRVASETAHDYANQLDRVMSINLNGEPVPQRDA